MAEGERHPGNEIAFIKFVPSDWLLLFGFEFRSTSSVKNLGSNLMHSSSGIEAGGGGGGRGRIIPANGNLTFLRHLDCHNRSFICILNAYR